MTISGSEETFKKITPLIEAQFPSFIREEGPKFVSFLKAYYEFLEQNGGPVNSSRSLIDYNDIDRTIDSFVDYFRREFMLNIPQNILADKRLLVKHIRDFYRTKGSEYSYRFLFRTLFDKEIDIIYPGDNILRASDGRWVRETILRVGEPFTLSPSQFDGRIITGTVSNARARCQGVSQITVLGQVLYELVVEDLNGTFVDGETVSDGEGTTATIISQFGSITGIQINNAGAFHSAGDRVTISSAGSSAEAIVASTNDQGPISFRILRGGSGYRLGPTQLTISGGSGSGARAVVTSLSNTTFINLNTDQIGPLRNVVLNTGPTFVSLGTNTAFVSANLATANISSTLSGRLSFAGALAGSINAISLISPGRGYIPELPEVTVRDQIVFESGILGQNGRIRGDDAIIVPIRAPGAITGLNIISSDSSFDRFSTASVVNLRGIEQTIDVFPDNVGIPRYTLRANTYSGNVTPSVSGVIQIGGRYVDTKGFLSWNMRLQDNDFYQEYSYLIKVTEIVDKYRDVVKKVLHPAGTKMFGSFMSYSNLNQSMKNLNQNTTIRLSVPIDVSKAVANTSAVFSLAGQETEPTGLHFSPSGRQLYVVGQFTDRVYQYSLSNPFRVSTATYTSKNFSIANTSSSGPGDTAPTDIKLSEDGTKLYVVGARNRIDQYTLSTAWDISTAVFSTKTKSVAPQDTSPQSLYFRDDGLTMYMLGSTNDRIYQYSLTTAWDISTATYASKFLSVAAQETSPQAMIFNSTGTIVLIAGSINDRVYQYSLSTPWDISTAVYSGKNISLAARETNPHALALNNDNTMLFVTGHGSDRIDTFIRTT